MSNDNTEIEEEVETTTPAAPAVEQTQEEESQQVDDTTQSPASGDETTENNDGIDYAAELARVTNQLGQAEHVIETLKRKPVENIVAEEEYEQAPSVDIDRMVDDKVNARMQDLVSDNVESIAESLTGNPDEQKLMLHYYNNKIQKSGFSRSNIREDMELARAMANSARITRENSELKRTAQVKKTIVNATPGSNQDRYEPSQSGTRKFSPEDQAIMAHYKVKPDEVSSDGVVSTS